MSDKKMDDRWFVLRVKRGAGTSLMDMRIVGGPYAIRKAHEVGDRCIKRYGSEVTFILVEHIGNEFPE